MTVLRKVVSVLTGRPGDPLEVRVLRLAVTLGLVFIGVRIAQDGLQLDALSSAFLLGLPIPLVNEVVTRASADPRLRGDLSFFLAGGAGAGAQLASAGQPPVTFQRTLVLAVVAWAAGKGGQLGPLGNMLPAVRTATREVGIGNRMPTMPGIQPQGKPTRGSVTVKEPVGPEETGGATVEQPEPAHPVAERVTVGERDGPPIDEPTRRDTPRA